MPLMGRRSRKRGRTGEAAPSRAGGGAQARSSRAERDAERRRRRADAVAASARGGGSARPTRRGTRERPPAPWGSFPLSELVVLLALVIGIAGLIVWGEQGPIMLLAGFAL